MLLYSAISFRRHATTSLNIHNPRIHRSTKTHNSAVFRCLYFLQSSLSASFTFFSLRNLLSFGLPIGLTYHNMLLEYNVIIFNQFIFFYIVAL